MEIDHIWGSGAVVGPGTRGVARLHAARGATGDPTRTWWRDQPRLLTQKRGQSLQSSVYAVHVPS